MAERIPPLTPVPSGELVRYEEMKRLAEMAWAALLSSEIVATPDKFALAAWSEAEAMYAESQARRPVE